MNESIRHRRDFLINLLYLAAILLIAYVFIKYAFWIFSPFIFAFLTALILQRPIRKLDKKTKNKFHAGWSILFVILILLVMVGPIAYILSLIIASISEFISYLTTQIQDLPSLLTTLKGEILNGLQFLPKSAYDSVSEWVTSTFDSLINNQSLDSVGIDTASLTSKLSTGASQVVSVVKGIPSILIGVIVYIIASIFMTKDYSSIVRFISAQLPKGKETLLFDLKKVFSTTVVKMMRAYFFIMCITFTELLIGFLILKALGYLTTSYFILIALGTAIFDILPIAGSGGVLITWAVIDLILGNYQLAIGLLIIYGVITIVRQYIEPKIVGSSLGVNPIVTLMGLYVGLKLLGVLGMIVVPVTIMTLKAFNDSGRIHLWKTIDRK